MATAAAVLVLVVLASVSYAQGPARIVVNENAPLFLQPDATMQPLRMASAGSALNVLGGETAANWYHVEFQDPQFGRRIGYIEKRFVTAARPQAVDLTIPEVRASEPQQTMTP